MTLYKEFTTGKFFKKFCFSHNSLIFVLILSLVGEIAKFELKTCRSFFE